MQLGQILLRKKWISPYQLKKAISLQSSKQRQLGEVLVQENIIVNEQLEIALQEQYWRKNGFWIIE